jgi:hypothetical protein
MTIRILCQGNGAISGRHYKPKPQIVTRAASVFLAMSGAMRGEVHTIGSSAAARLTLSISGCVVGMGKSNLRRQARTESAFMLAQISESGAAVGDLGGTRQEAPLARRTPEVRQADRRLSNQPRSAQADQLARLASAF